MLHHHNKNCVHKTSSRELFPVEEAAYQTAVVVRRSNSVKHLLSEILSLIKRAMYEASLLIDSTINQTMETTLHRDKDINKKENQLNNLENFNPSKLHLILLIMEVSSLIPKCQIGVLECLELLEDVFCCLFYPGS